MELKEDVLGSTTAELSYGLCCFITELKRPNGEPYCPDSLFYLCLGIQQARRFTRKHDTLQGRVSTWSAHGGVSPRPLTSGEVKM